MSGIKGTILHPLALKSNVKVLKIIAEAGDDGIYQLEIARRFGASQAFASQILDRLELDGLVNHSYQKGTRSIRKVYTLAEPEWYEHIFSVPLAQLLHLLN